MHNAGRHIIALTGAALLTLSASTTAHGDTETAGPAGDGTASWYGGLAMHGLLSDNEHDGDLVVDFDFLGPRVYGGRRIKGTQPPRGATVNASRGYHRACGGYRVSDCAILVLDIERGECAGCVVSTGPRGA